MAALTKDRATPERDGRRVIDPIGPTTVIHAGAMYMLNEDGDAVPAAAQAGSTTWKVRAVATRRAASSAGDATVDGACGVFRFENSAAADEITRADIGATCYAVDDCTLAKTSDTGKRPEAGKVLDVDAAGVWVRVGA